MLRNNLFTHWQSEGLRFFDFVTELRQLSKECEFGELKSSVIRDLIIFGLSDNRLRERMLREPELTLQKAIELGQAADETKELVKELSCEVNSPSSIHQVSRSAKTTKPQKTNFRAGCNKCTMINNCKFCGKTHKRRECPAYGCKCHKCKHSVQIRRCIKLIMMVLYQVNKVVIQFSS